MKERKKEKSNGENFLKPGNVVLVDEKDASYEPRFVVSVK